MVVLDPLMPTALEIAAVAALIKKALGDEPKKAEWFARVLKHEYGEIERRRLAIRWIRPQDQLDGW